MALTASEVMEFVKENDIKFVRLAFCNLLGVQKNIAIMSAELPSAFEGGVCVDTASVEGFLSEDDADIFLFPDPDTLTILPWRPAQGRVARLFCDIRKADGTLCPSDGRALLHRAVEKLADVGYTCQIGCECEFYLFRLDENGEPTRVPHDNAVYLDTAPRDKGENVRREICIALEEMGIRVESSHHERGPGQNEICLHYVDALEAADHLITTRGVIEVIAARSGLSASFLPKPLPEQDGNSIHVNLSLCKNGRNIFRADETHNPVAESFVAGILQHLPEMTAFLNPLPESYLRFGADIPATVSWSRQNRNQIIRIPAAGSTHARMELRSSDSSMNPYFSFALLLEAGMLGMAQEMALVRDTPPENAASLPKDLRYALDLTQTGPLVTAVIPAETLLAYQTLKQEENGRYLQAGRGR